MFVIFIPLQIICKYGAKDLGLLNNLNIIILQLKWCYNLMFLCKVEHHFFYLILIQYIFKAPTLWADAFYKSKCPSVCLSVCLSVRLFTFEVAVKCLFSPISRSRMSNIFRYLEFLGKINEKKWSQIWTFLFESCLKSPRKKSFFVVADFALQNMVETTLPNGLETSGSKGVSPILAYL